jgi:xylan 1,4-beta-xylosidase
MSYWVFTDTFEEAGPRFTPFHGGFGLLNYQSLNKPSFYSYKFMNMLGETELANVDARSWACTNVKGGVQILLWDYTHTHPGDSVNNQVYYLRDLPPQIKEKVHIRITGIPAGTYALEIYKVGYRSNDPYAAYLALNRPAQLTPQQVELIKKTQGGQQASTEAITIKADGAFSRELDLRENDAFLLNLVKQVKK